MINFRLLAGHGAIVAHGSRYRGFLFGILAYYMSDALWGILAGLNWTCALYIDTIFFFLSLVVFVFMWSRFACAYLRLSKFTSRLIAGFGYALLLGNIIAIVANIFNNCLFYFDAKGTYLLGPVRLHSFACLVCYGSLIPLIVLFKVLAKREPFNGRNLTVFVNSITMTVAVALCR